MVQGWCNPQSILLSRWWALVTLRKTLGANERSQVVSRTRVSDYLVPIPQVGNAVGIRTSKVSMLSGCIGLNLTAKCANLQLRKQFPSYSYKLPIVVWMLSFLPKSALLSRHHKDIAVLERYIDYNNVSM